MSKETALVTGAAGFVGSHLSERLLAEGFRVIGIDSFTDYYPRHYKEGNVAALRQAAEFSLIERDIRELDLPALLRDQEVRCVFHIAGQAGVRSSWGQYFDEYVSRNVLATQALLEASRTVNLTRFIFASSSSVYGDAEKFPTGEEALPRPLSPYGVTKLAAEHLCMLYAKQYGVPAVALRYFTVYGPRQRPDMAFHLFIRALLYGQPIQVLGDGEQTREFTFVSDIVDANLLALRRAPGTGLVYNIGGGTRVTVNAALALLGELMQVTPRIEYRARAAGDHRHGGADISRAQRELGYQPCVPLREGLERQIEWQKQVEI